MQTAILENADMMEVRKSLPIYYPDEAALQRIFLLLLLFMLLLSLSLCLGTNPRVAKKCMQQSYFCKQASTPDSLIADSRPVSLMKSQVYICRCSSFTLPDHKNPINLLVYPPITRFWYHNPP